MLGRGAFGALALVGSVLVTACGGGGTAAPAASASGSRAAAPTPPPPVKLVVAYSEIYEGQLPVWAAFEAGYFKQNGLDVDLRYIPSTTAIQALVANEVQVTQGGGSEAMAANLGGSDLM